MIVSAYPRRLKLGQLTTDKMTTDTAPTVNGSAQPEKLATSNGSAQAKSEKVGKSPIY